MKHTNFVGAFIRQRRESLKLSQKALGQLFSPAVTTQFVSNVERGITPLPTNHIPKVIEALQIPEKELMALFEKDYVHRLSHKMGKDGFKFNPQPHSDHHSGPGEHHLKIDPEYWSFFNQLYYAYSHADWESRKGFHQVCESLFKIHAEKKSA